MAEVQHSSCADPQTQQNADVIHQQHRRPPRVSIGSDAQPGPNEPVETPQPSSGVPGDAQRTKNTLSESRSDRSSDFLKETKAKMNLNEEEIVKERSRNVARPRLPEEVHGFALCTGGRDQHRQRIFEALQENQLTFVLRLSQTHTLITRSIIIIIIITIFIITLR